MFSLTRLAAVALFLIAVGGCQGGAPAAPPTIAQGDYPAVVAYLKQRIAYDLDAQRVPGLSIAIVDDQRTVWSSGFGYADSARHRTATGDTLYRVGAISKLVTAAGVLRGGGADGVDGREYPRHAGRAGRVPGGKERHPHVACAHCGSCLLYTSPPKGPRYRR